MRKSCTKWRADNPDKLRRMALRDEYKDVPWTGRQIAAVLGGVTPDTLYRWYKKYPDLKAAAEEIREPADDAVVNALYKNCVGYTVEEVKETLDAQGNLLRKEVIKKPVTPMPNAQTLWLRNRRPEEWNNDKQQIELSGSLKTTDIPDDELINRAEAVIARRAKRAECDTQN